MVDELLRNLDKTPSKSSVYVWADYIELRCLLHPDRYFTLDGAEEALTGLGLQRRLCRSTTRFLQ